MSDGPPRRITSHASAHQNARLFTAVETVAENGRFKETSRLDDACELSQAPIKREMDVPISRLRVHPTRDTKVVVQDRSSDRPRLFIFHPVRS